MPDCYRREQNDVERTLEDLRQCEVRLEARFERWSELESRLGGDAFAVDGGDHAE